MVNVPSKCNILVSKTTSIVGRQRDVHFVVNVEPFRMVIRLVLILIIICLDMVLSLPVRVSAFARLHRLSIFYLLCKKGHPGHKPKCFLKVLKCKLLVDCIAVRDYVPRPNLFQLLLSICTFKLFAHSSGCLNCEMTYKKKWCS